MTPEGLLRVLRNQTLVDTLTAGGAPLEITVTLRPAPGTPSGFAWSTGVGPRTPIAGGTGISVAVEVDQRAPISMVLPVLKSTIGG